MQGRYISLDDGRRYIPIPNPNPSFRNFNNRSNNSYNRNDSFSRRPSLPPPPPSKQEILMRAGKLAAEYLVSQGLLNPEKLPHHRGQNGKFKDFGALKYDREDEDSENEAGYGRSESYRERQSGYDHLPARSENTMESRSENQDFMEDGGSKISSLSLKKDASCEVVGDNVVVVVNSEVSEEVKNDVVNDSKKKIIMEDNNNGDDDNVMGAIVQENTSIELKEEDKEIVVEEKNSNKRKREDDELVINNVKAKESSSDEEIDAPLEIKEGKIDDKTEEEEKHISSEQLKTCDVKLMHGIEVTENETGKELSVNIEHARRSNNGNVSVGFDNISNDDDDKAVEVSNIDIEVAMDGSNSDPSNPKDEERIIREEPIYPNLDSFLDQNEHADLNGIRDGYSLEFPNFLKSDITRCPSVSTDLNNLGYGMEGVSNDDDSMYMSLGEIPIGFMEVWDPQAQDYGKFF